MKNNWRSRFIDMLVNAVRARSDLNKLRTEAASKIGRREWERLLDKTKRLAYNEREANDKDAED